MPRIVLLALACAALTGCWGNGERAEPPAGTDGGPTGSGMQAPTEPAAVPVTLVPIQPEALRRCRRFAELAEICPLQAPEGRFGPGSGAYQASSSARFPRPGAWTFSLQQGGEHPGRPELDRPPATVHVVVTAAPPFPTALPRQTELRDGLMEKRRRKPLFLGHATWGGREGVLVLAPPYPLGGLQSNHLIFSWALGSKAVSLHGWEPFTEVPDVLQAVVESIPESP